MKSVLSPTWRLVICPRCGRTISEFKPAGTPTSGVLPTIDYTDACAVCAQEKRK